MAKLSDCKKQNLNPFASLRAKLCSAHLPKSTYLSRIAVNKNICLLGETKNKKFEEESDKIDYENPGHSPKHHGEQSPKLRKYVVGSECKSEKHSPKKHQKSCKRNSFSKSTGFLLEEQRRSCKGI